MLNMTPECIHFFKVYSLIFGVLRMMGLKDTVFIAVLFIIAKAWKQPRCLPVGEQINKLWYIHTMEYYSVSKKKK